MNIAYGAIDIAYATMNVVGWLDEAAMLRWPSDTLAYAVIECPDRWVIG